MKKKISKAKVIAAIFLLSLVFIATKIYAQAMPEPKSQKTEETKSQVPEAPKQPTPEESKKKIKELYKKAISDFKKDKLDLAREAFEKILAFDPAENKARDYLQSKIPAKIKQQEKKKITQKIKQEQLALKKAEEEHLSQTKELKKQQKVAAGKTELKKPKEEKTRLKKRAEGAQIKTPELKQPKNKPKGLTLQKSLNQQILALTKQNKELKQKEAVLLQDLTKAKKFNAQLETKAKEFYINTLETEQAKKEVKDLSNIAEEINNERLVLKKENVRLKQQIVSLEDSQRNEKAKLYQELGTVYAEAKLFDLGIDAYEKSLSFNPDNAEVHYNIGILYKHSKSDSKKAAQHLKKYLRLNPEAKNRKEVEYLIKMLETQPF
jgi:tetratricopeptide (TPR) repeat protein